MCENYDYDLYATGFDSKLVASLQRSITSVPTAAGGTRVDATKTALQDFFMQYFKKFLSMKMKRDSKLLSILIKVLLAKGKISRYML